MEYDDIALHDDEDFKPEDVLAPGEDGSATEDEESVFNFLFPEGVHKKKKKGGKALINAKNQFSEKVYNLKKEKKTTKTTKIAQSVDLTSAKASSPPKRKQPSQVSQIDNNTATEQLSRGGRTPHRNQSMKSIKSVKSTTSAKGGKSPSEKSRKPLGSVKGAPMTH